MRHVVMFSGGVGSWAAAKRVIEKHGTKDLVLLFSDTLTEDADLYRFLIETAAALHNANASPQVDVSDLITRCRSLPEWGTPEYRAAVRTVGMEAVKRLPMLRWAIDGRDIFQVFMDVRFLGNTRAAKCSWLLKQKTAREALEAAGYDPGSTILYVGIDWTEIHRLEGVQRGWAPWRVETPMCDEPYIVKTEMLDLVKQEGIEIARLYKLGLAHNNCGGGCVKAGMAHWRHLLKADPERYRQWEAKEEEVRQYLGKDVSMLRDRSSAAKCVTCSGAGFKNDQPCDACEGSGRTTKPMTLRQFREQTLIQPGLFDPDDWGGCGCFTIPEPETVGSHE